MNNNKSAAELLEEIDLLASQFTPSQKSSSSTSKSVVSSTDDSATLLKKLDAAKSKLQEEQEYHQSRLAKLAFSIKQQLNSYKERVDKENEIFQREHDKFQIQIDECDAALTKLKVHVKITTKDVIKDVLPQMPKDVLPATK